MTNFRKIILGSASAVLLMTGFGCVVPAMAAISHNHTEGSGHSIVDFNENVEPGTVVVSASQRRLYYALGDGTAISYRVAVPKRGKEWSGETSVAFGVWAITLDIWNICFFFTAHRAWGGFMAHL